MDTASTHTCPGPCTHAPRMWQANMRVDRRRVFAARVTVSLCQARHRHAHRAEQWQIHCGHLTRS
jgi:hypothetical protein